MPTAGPKRTSGWETAAASSTPRTTRRSLNNLDLVLDEIIDWSKRVKTFQKLTPFEDACQNL